MSITRKKDIAPKSARVWLLAALNGGRVKREGETAPISTQRAAYEMRGVLRWWRGTNSRAHRMLPRLHPGRSTYGPTRCRMATQRSKLIPGDFIARPRLRGRRLTTARDIRRSAEPTKPRGRNVGSFCVLRHRCVRMTEQTPRERERGASLENATAPHCASAPPGPHLAAAGCAAAAAAARRHPARALLVSARASAVTTAATSAASSLL